MDKIFSYLDPNSPIPQVERQARLLAAALCGFYALAAIYLFVVGATLLLQVITGQAAGTLSWALGVLAMSILLAAITVGLWRLRRWAVTFSALILTAALVYSVIGDIEQTNWLLAILKAVVVGPAILTGHMRLWKEAWRRQQNTIEPLD